MWRRQRRVFRPWQPLPGEHLVIDWTTEGGWQVFCAVLAWSRWRFVRVARDQKAVTTMRLLAECFEELGGVPKVVLADRMGCLKGGVVANVMVPTPDYVRFATHFGFRPDFCEAADPESKGVVEALCRYAQDAATGAATRLHGLKTPGHGRRPRYSDGVRRAEPGEGAGQEVPVRAARQGLPLDRPIRDERVRPRHATGSARGARQRYGFAAAFQDEPEAACCVGGYQPRRACSRRRGRRDSTRWWWSRAIEPTRSTGTCSR